jgi:hypothetical protein
MIADFRDLRSCQNANPPRRLPAAARGVPRSGPWQPAEAYRLHNG